MGNLKGFEFMRKENIYIISLQVHKKILCQPLSGLFRNSDSRAGSLCKAQSCSSIIRDGIHNPNANALSTSSSSITKNQNKFDEKLLDNRELIYNNRLNSRFVGSDAAIHKEASYKDDEKHAILDFIDDNILCSSKC